MPKKNRIGWVAKPCVFCGKVWSGAGTSWNYRDKKVHRNCLVDTIVKLEKELIKCQT